MGLQGERLSRSSVAQIGELVLEGGVDLDAELLRQLCDRLAEERPSIPVPGRAVGVDLIGEHDGQRRLAGNEGRPHGGVEVGKQAKVAGGVEGDIVGDVTTGADAEVGRNPSHRRRGLQRFCANRTASGVCGEVGCGEEDEFAGTGPHALVQPLMAVQVGGSGFSAHGVTPCPNVGVRSWLAGWNRRTV